MEGQIHPWKVLLGWHLAIFVLRGLVLVLGPLDLFIEEAQYWVWSQRPALSYYSKPPMVAYVNWLSTSIFGSTEFALKLNALSLGLIYSLLTYAFSYELFRNVKQALVASLLVYALPMNHLIFNVFSTDSLLLVFWALTTLLFWRAIQTDKVICWVAVGVFAGMGFLSKYTMVLFAPIAFLYLFWHRVEVFRKRGIYISLFITFLFMLPVLIWNWQMDFISFKHLADEGKTALTIGKRLQLGSEFIGSEIGMLSPFLFPFIVGAIIDAFRRKSAEHFYLLLAPLLVFSFFLVYSFTKRVEVNWPFFSYFTIPILLANYYENLNKKKGFHIATITSIVLIVPFFYLSVYLQPLGLNHIMPPKKDPARRLYGWNTLGKRVQQKIDQYAAKDYFIFSDSYHVASEVAFYTEDQQVPFCINLGRRRNQFDLWDGIRQFEGTDQVGIFVTKEKELPTAVIAGFEQLVATDIVEIELGHQVVWRYHIAVLRGLIHIEERESKSY
ncbi:MAG: glycosyltransferase family 39 protein [Bacteroidota bacterium]